MVTDAPNSASTDMGSAAALAEESGAIAQNQPAGDAPPDGSGDAGLAVAQTIPAGVVRGADGDTFITRVDGATVKASPGTTVFRGDILATREGASVSVSFANEAEFFLGSSGRMLVESIAPSGDSSDPQSVYFVLHGQFGFAHRSGSFSGGPGAVVRTPVATLQVHNGRVAGKAAAEAVENVFTLLKNGDGSLGFMRVVTAGAAVVLQEEWDTAQVVSLFREPVIVDRPDIAGFVDLFGIAVSQWLESPALAPALGGEGGDDAPGGPPEIPSDGGPSARYLPPAEPGEVAPAQVAALEDGFVALPSRPDVAPAAEPARNRDDGASAPVLDTGPVLAVSAFPGPGENITLVGGAGANDVATISAAPTAVNNLTITDVNGQVVLRDTATNATVTLDNFETLDLNLGTAGDAITIGDLSGTDISDNTVIVDAGDGNDTVDASAAGKRVVLTGGTGDDVLTGGSRNDDLFGNAGADTLTGNAGNDTLDGGSGADTLIGGAGDDTYIVDDAGDTVDESSGSGTDTVQSSVTFSLTGNASTVENLTLTGSGSINATGNALANTLTGNSGNNTLDGGAGVDTLVGGAGDDTYVVDSSADVVTENAGEGTDLVQSSATTFTLSANVENLTLTGSGNINGAGNELANVLTGNSGNNSLSGAAGDDTLVGGAGNDTLDGGAGADAMTGGTGNDTYVVDNAGDTVSENAGEGTDIVQSSITASLTTLSANVENLTLTGAAAIDGTGNALGNVLTGNSAGNTLTGLDGNDTLDGQGGVDTLIGGTGDDTYVVDQTADIVTEAFGEGTDLVQSSAATFTLSANVENLTLTGGGNINGVGNALVNTLTGNSGNNVLEGGLGGDTLIGGGGTDTATYANAAGPVTADLQNGGSAGEANGDSYNGIENLIGSASADTLLGDGSANRLDGGAGGDTMTGRDGDDTYVVDDALDTVVEAGNGIDTIESSLDFDLTTANGNNVENLTLTGAATSAIGNGLDNVLTGNALANTLTGNGGNDTLNGGAGADAMTGGTGNDTYIVDNAGDTVTELAGEGTDTVQSSIDFDLSTSGGNIENLTLTGSAINGTGNELANTITGNSQANTLVGNGGADTLNGGNGADSMRGGSGDDTYIVDNTGDTITEFAAEGTDTVQSSASSYTLSANVENLTLTGNGNIIGIGNNLANTITGNGQSNTLLGGGGIDILTGGAGADKFFYSLTSDGGGIGGAGDTVTDFASGTDVFQFLQSQFGNIDVGSLTDGVNFATTNNGLAYDGTNVNVGAATDRDAGNASFIFGGGTLSYDPDGNTTVDAGFTIATGLGATLVATDVEITANAPS